MELKFFVFQKLLTKQEIGCVTVNLHGVTSTLTCMYFYILNTLKVIYGCYACYTINVGAVDPYLP
jgi:hypothetical protein